MRYGRQRSWIVILLGAVSVFVTACTPIEVRSTTSVHIASPTAAILTPAVVTVTTSASQILLPSSTPSPTLTTIPVTGIPLPTLSPRDEEAYWLNLITTNQDCELPCWWGIVPGTATPNDLLSFLVPLGVNDIGPAIPWKDGSRYYHYALRVNQADILNLTATFSEKNDVIQSIDVLADNFRIFPELADSFQRHSLSQVLGRHGTPSRVLLGLQPPAEPNAGFTYDIWLFYEQSGILIDYFGVGVAPKGDSLDICPAHSSLLEIRLYLQSPHSATSLEKLTEGGADFDALIAQGRLRTLEEVTNLGLDDFRQILANDDGACFQSPTEIW